MDRNRREIAFSKQLVQFGGPQGALDEDDDLVEFKRVEEIVELAILLTLAKSDGILLQAVQSEGCLIVDVQFHRISHEFSADGPDLLRKCGAEHHDLLLGRCVSEDLLNVSSHV